MNNILDSHWITIASLIGVIFLTIYNIVSPKLRVRQTDYDQAGKDLIKLLQDTKVELQAENTILREEFEVLKTRFDAMNKDYENIKNIFQGRDEETIKFRSQGFAAFEQMRQASDMTVVTHAKVMETLMLQKKILEKLEK